MNFASVLNSVGEEGGGVRIVSVFMAILAES